jgi:hypothetical protein
MVHISLQALACVDFDVVLRPQMSSESTSSLKRAFEPGPVPRLPHLATHVSSMTVLLSAASLNAAAAVMPLCQLGQAHAFCTSSPSALISSAYLNECTRQG